MIKIQHKWIKNRNLVSNRTVLSFDSNGIATVNELGCVKEDIEAIMNHHPGQMVIVQDEVKTPDVQDIKPVDVATKAIADQKSEDDMNDAIEEQELAKEASEKDDQTDHTKKKKHPMMKIKTKE